MLSVALQIIEVAATDDFLGFLGPIDVGDLTGLAHGVGGLLVGEEVVSEPFHQHGGALADVLPVAIGGVTLQDGNNLIVGFVTVQHAQAADGVGAHVDIHVGNVLFREDADVQGVTVTDDVVSSGLVAAILGHLFPAIGLGHKAIEFGADVGEALGPVDAQQARHLVEFILHRVGGQNLDIGVDGIGCFGSD